MNSKQIDIEDAVVDGIISNYENKIVEKLLNGEDVHIKGLGVIYPSYRKVKNDRGRQYSIRIKVRQSKDFNDSIIESFEKDNTKFLGGN